MKGNLKESNQMKPNNSQCKFNHNQISTNGFNLLHKKHRLFNVTKDNIFNQSQSNNSGNNYLKQYKLKPLSSLSKNDSKDQYLSSPKSMMTLPTTSEELNLKYNALQNITEKDNEITFLRQDYLRHHDLKELDRRKRRILLDWLMEVCKVFNFQRETYHSAAVILDIYLSRVPSVLITQFQLIGITCLFISAKNEEILIPTTSNFAQTTNYTFITNDILVLEKKILKVLNWKIQYPNMAFWLNYLMFKWDIFSENNDAKMPRFKIYHSMSKVSLWLIDAISLDYEHILKNMKILTCVVLYIVIGLQSCIFTIEDVKNLFCLNENYIENYPQFNMFFNSFLMKELEVELSHFREHFNYVSSFVSHFDLIEDDESDFDDVYNQEDFNNQLKQEKKIRMQDYAKSKSLTVQLIEEKRLQEN